MTKYYDPPDYETEIELILLRPPVYPSSVCSLFLPSGINHCSEHCTWYIHILLHTFCTNVHIAK